MTAEEAVNLLLLKVAPLVVAEVQNLTTDIAKSTDYCIGRMEGAIFVLEILESKTKEVLAILNKV